MMSLSSVVESVFHWVDLDALKEDLHNNTQQDKESPMEQECKVKREDVVEVEKKYAMDEVLMQKVVGMMQIKKSKLF